MTITKHGRALEFTLRPVGFKCAFCDAEFYADKGEYEIVEGPTQCSPSGQLVRSLSLHVDCPECGWRVAKTAICRGVEQRPLHASNYSVNKEDIFK